MKQALRKMANCVLGLAGWELQRVTTNPNIVTSGDIVRVMHGGKRYEMFVANRMDFIQRCHFAGTLFEPEELELIARHFKPGGTFVDIGANVGNHTAFAAVGLDAAAVHAFEPSDGAFRVLKTNVALNDLTGRVRLVKKALSDQAGTANLENALATNIGRARIVEGATGATEQIAIAVGDTELADIDVDFLKIDVEGHEMAALRGLSGVLARCSPTIFIEVNDGNAAAFDEWLAGSGYEIAERGAIYSDAKNYLLKRT